MAEFPFIGESYQLRSPNMDSQRSLNLFLTKSETQTQAYPKGTSKSMMSLQVTPGKVLFAALPDTPIRGEGQVLGRAFAVAGYGLYEVFSNGSYVLRGTMLTNAGIVSIANNGFQLCIVDGTITGGYILTLATNAFAQITNPYFLGANTVCFIDGYFMFNKPNSGIYYLSNLYDGLTGDPLAFATAEGSPDNLIAVKPLHKEVWLFGTNTIQVVTNTGGTFPFTPNASGYIEYGCIAYGSIAHTANTLLWLGNDDEGAGVVWMATGYQPQRISTYAVEFAIQGYTTISDAVGYTYQEDGHYFYCLNFTTANTTWVYDIGMGLWHERAFFVPSRGQYERDRGQTHMYAFGKHLVGDYANGNIYQQSLGIYQDNGNPIRWMRTAPHIADDLEYIYHSRIQIDMETGTGLITGGIQDVNPQVMLSWSDDGGHVYSNEYLMDVGRIGNYKTRCYRNRLGRSRDRIYKVAGSTNTKTYLIAGRVLVDQGTN